ncbi:MAG TPA: transglutaminase domain-containing protein, partial [Candidatus Thermoplasmatota archaeon]|nr:transglutaminase domain-containing protein [Candidatus Thermoplasmatota archaeon]
GSLLSADGVGEASLELPDGSWRIRYWVDGERRGTLSPVRIDTTAPAVVGLESVGDAVGGAYALGASAIVGPDAVETRVVDLESGALLGSSLPVQLSGLADGLHAYQVALRDAAGNWGNRTVQVRSGAAVVLPAGEFTYGVVARYTNEVRLWDLTRASEYLSRTAARSAVGGDYLGPGFGIAPGDPLVEAVVDEVVTPEMNTLEAARALFVWMADNLEYDEARLDRDSLLEPHQVIGDLEDPSDLDSDDDGLVRDGGGNGVRGGVCRDLAATYVSLLRAVGVPARLVSGYVGGSVDGFHAWVEFYGGRVATQAEWIPVDVSPLDGAFRDSLLLQAFAIRLPDYLPLRAIPSGDEVQGWSTAIGVRYQWPSEQAEPNVRLQEEVTIGFDQRAVLCLDPATSARRVAEDEEECSRLGFDRFLPDFLVATERTIDYGVEVLNAPVGSRIRSEVAYPAEDTAVPDLVHRQFYGDGLGSLEEGKAHFDDTV